jgi:hypothetical protein
MVTLPPGVTRQQVTIGVTGDIVLESNEAFALTLSNPSGHAVIGGPQALGLIQDDDLLFIPIDPIDSGSDDSDSEDSGSEDTSDRDLTEAERASRAAALQVESETGLIDAALTEVSRVVTEAAGGDEDSLSRVTTATSDNEDEQTARIGDIRLYFVIVGVSGDESGKKYELPPELLMGDRLLDLFKKFPNGHYRVYLQQDRSVRRLYDLHVYNSELVTPENPATQAAPQDEPTGVNAAALPSTPAPVLGRNRAASSQSESPAMPIIGSLNLDPEVTIERETGSMPLQRFGTSAARGPDGDSSLVLSSSSLNLVTALLFAGQSFGRAQQRAWDERVDDALGEGGMALSRTARMIRRLRF